MKKISLGLVLLASCSVLLGIASAASSGSTSVEATLGSGIGIGVSDVGPWALSIGPNTINNYITVYQLGGSVSVNWAVSASASNGGYLTSINVPTHKLGVQLKANGQSGVTLDGTSRQVAIGSIGVGSSASVNLPLFQQLAYSDVPHNDYHLTITYTITP